MERREDAEGRYRVLLLGIEDNTEEKKNSFCKRIFEIYGISLPLLRRITENCPTVLKKNLTVDKALTLAKTLKSYGAIISVERWRNCSAISLEFQSVEPSQLALESSYLRRASSGVWNVIGRVRNISEENLDDIWVLVQVFDDDEEIVSFEEAPIPINPLPSKEASPFRVILEAGLPVKRASLAFKKASGTAVSVVDRRERKDWVEVRWETDDDDREIEGMERLSASAAAPIPGETSQPAEGTVSPPRERGSLLKFSQEEPEISEEELPPPTLPPLSEGAFCETASDTEPEPFGPQISLPMTEEIERMVIQGESEAITESSALPKEEILLEKEPEPPERNEALPLGLEMIDHQEEKNRQETASRRETSPFVMGPFVKKEEVSKNWDDWIHADPSLPERREVLPGAHFDFSIFEEASKLLEEISKEPVKKEKDEPALFPWIEDFRKSIENYYQKNQEPFSSWFNSCRHSDGLDDPCRAVLTILVQARFNQRNQSEKALENTQKVFRLLHQPNLTLEQIPPLEGTPFFTGESWRELFHRAIPKLQQVASHILEKKRWIVSDLERLIQVIPHMGDRNSRLAIRWMHELIPEAVDIDGSTIPISVGESLYRVGARLGVIDPHFDTYQGKNSIGDLKIQAFARMAFPRFPWKIEEPMTGVGGGSEDGRAGHCLPIQPQCEGCLFESFCPKFYLDFNPSEKGVKTRQ
ncbi:MAG: hypothetical protein ACUVWO_08985 [Thermodesulfobacteriota bacterium]